MRLDFEVIVVGAGPAGSSAAAVLARRGCSVLLLDKSRFPRDKICGDGLSQRTLAQICNFAEAAEAPIRPSARIRVVFGNGDSEFLEDPTHRPALATLPRITLDECLLAPLRNEPTVTFLEDSVATRVREFVDGRVQVDVVTHATAETTTYTSRAVIDASGASSRLARQFRLQSSTRPLRAIAVRGYFDGLEPGALEPTVVLDRSIQPGYLWLFPVGATSANVGIGQFPSEGGSHPIEVLRDQILRNANAEVLRTAVLRRRFQGGTIPCLTNLASRVRSKVLFCGDAGAFADPLTAEGIPYAIESGRLAASTIADALSTSRIDADSLAPYDLAWRRAFGNRLLSRNWVNGESDRQPSPEDRMSSIYERAFMSACRSYTAEIAHFASHATLIDRWPTALP